MKINNCKGSLIKLAATWSPIEHSQLNSHLLYVNNVITSFVCIQYIALIFGPFHDMPCVLYEMHGDNL